MLDPITTGIVVVLGKYALDKGAELGAEVGPKALDTAKEMVSSALNYLRREPKSEVIVAEYEEDPETYAKPLEKKLDIAIQTDPALKAELEALLLKFDEEAETYAAAQGTTYTAVLKGSGAIAQGKGATAVGERGVNVGGNAGGPIITGSGNVVNIGRSAASSVSLPSSLAPLRDNLSTYFNKSELKSLCFDLGVASDDLPGETRSELAQALVEHCYERGRLPELISRCQAERPHVNWQ
ncbi:MAG TPA: hypothetical protein EYP41_18280 [Anaerolineae bacterium]|nr:hypothetical protein [Anaerolineae bacterium]